MGVDHADGAFQRGHVNGDVVAIRADVIEVGDVMDGARDAPCGIHGNVGIVAVYVHAQLFSGIGNQGADCAQADDAQLLASDLAASELLLCLLDRFGDVGVGGVVADPLVAGDDAAAAQKHAADDEFLNGVGVGAWGVEDDDALVGAAIQRDVVHASAGTGDGQQILGELRVVQLHAANQHAVGFLQRVDQAVVAGQLVGALLRDVVETMDARHEVPFDG